MASEADLIKALEKLASSNIALSESLDSQVSAMDRLIDHNCALVDNIVAAATQDEEDSLLPGFLGDPFLPEDDNQGGGGLGSL